MSHSTSAPELSQRTFTISGRFAPPRIVSFVKISFVSYTPFMRCERVFAPLIPDVALVELPPQKDDLSRRTTAQPFSRQVLAAATPASPPPTTIACEAGNTHAIAKVLF